jgi:hypothetical protein
VEWEKEEDEFPREEEEETLLRGKEQTGKPGFTKPKVALCKAQSEGNIEQGEGRKEDASIEVKLREQEPSHRLIKREESMGAKLEEVCPLSLPERVRLEKENYDKCGRMIDSTIIELL